MKQNVNTAAVAFGIDHDVLTFGETEIITFEERKAFLVVLGAAGLTVDGCQVFPNDTIPLTNNTEFEIHGKRFKFTYPPKELRAKLYASPAKPNNRALRLSMINSAQVFSPRPLPCSLLQLAKYFSSKLASAHSLRSIGLY
ncbi:hypothetical protein VKT23_011860 [Stygiomarasmius scandens]|uniref:Uncharacterized protein n=1 Tax=Marasmiellus scandens TaxID=2682957 RepID=A0ABR1J7Y5_9AGAR